MLTSNEEEKIVRINAVSAAIVFSSVIVVAASAADNPDFKPFASKEGKFAVSMPGKPETSSSMVKTPTAEMELHSIRGSRGKELYLVTYNDFPAEIMKAGDPEKLLDSARDGGVETTHGKVTKETKIAKTDKTPASRDLEIEIQGTTAYYRMILVGSRLYVIMAYPDGSKGSPERAKQFLDSFKVAKDEAAPGKR